jgi:L-fuconolactonase
MTVIDTHVHVIGRYPSMAPLDDLGRVDRLLHLMDEAGVERAVMVPAVAPASPDNNAECARWALQHPDRLVNLVELSLHHDDAAEQVARVPERYHAAGISYYPPGDIGWMLDESSEPMWEAMGSAGLALSIQVTPAGYGTLIEVARRHPGTPFLCNHLGLPAAVFAPDDPQYGGLAAARELPNLFVKASAFYAAADRPWDTRCGRALAYFGALLSGLGAQRIMWGSDWPPAGRHITYRQSLEIVRSIAPLEPEQRALILGGNAARVFDHWAGD